jgi:Flp pilus assembly protein TadD
MGDELGRKQPGWAYPSETWVAECERELAAEKGRTVPPREVSPAVALDRKNAASLYFQARGLAARGDNDGAIGKLEEATRLDPDNVSVLILLGSIYCDQQGKHDQAITYFEKAIRLVPKDSLVHKNLGVARHRSGDTNGAIAAYREALKLDPAMPEAHCNLGLLLQKRGQLEEALAELRMGDELGRKQPGWAYPSKWWVAECERALERRAPPPREVKRP